MNLNYNLILASKSPRRQELLTKLDLKFEVKVKSIDESYPSDLVKTLVAEYLAKKKSKAFGILGVEDLLITSDTTVVFNNEVLEKASSATEAKEMLSTLSGKTHEVITGVCLRTNKNQTSFSEVTEVKFKNLSEFEIEYYIHNYSPFDKAGAYGIQEWIGMIGIEWINGDFYNVMGLPLFRLYNELKKFS